TFNLSEELDVISEEETTNLENINSLQDAAYIIYTSGTTGLPKGVVIEHENVIRLLLNDEMEFDFNANDVWTMFHSYCFDFSVWEMYGALLYGGKLVIVPRFIAQSPEVLTDLLLQEKVTVLNQTPTAFYALMQEGSNFIRNDLALRYIIFGGEALSPMKLHKAKKAYPHTKLINMYGITEVTVHATYREVTEGDIEGEKSNIGHPIPTTTTYILDEQQKPVPLGVIGELFIGGKGIARGYLNREELTRNRFLANPFKPGEKMYRSGDLARWLPDGTLEYMGRMDHQVKIRGYRIECGEIEAQLLKHESVNETLVMARESEDGSKYLAAYIVSETQVDVTELRRHLEKHVPSYMVPAYFIQVERMPLTSNGKVDRKALPLPEEGWMRGNEYVAPQGEMEEQLAEIWKEVLGIEQVGRTDNFFELGGDSIKAV
ncbi:non-ribosomal peptide synthetase, partial [Paenibacillus helianthi]|uniref:non-ribosomal peptide synthetase n=1 Tax=Paenibacillus helianthi TaxID=1349432 RepID=UPI000B0437FC